MSTDKRFSTADWSKNETNAEDGAEWSGLGGSDTVPVDTDDMDLDIAGGEHERDQASDNGKGKGKEKILKPLTPEALAAFEAAQKRAGIIYISRIPPGMRPQKLRHIMSGYGEVGRIYMAFEDPKYAHERRKHTNSKVTRANEGWVEFTDKKVARSVADMLNGQAVGGKRGDRHRDDVWTMKYLPKFKWNLLTEQLRHDKAVHAARMRIELSRSTREQEDYLKQVSLAKTFENRAKRKNKKPDDRPAWTNVFEGPQKTPKPVATADAPRDSRTVEKEGQLKDVLGRIF
ncbi:RNA-binding ATPase activator esf2 [Tulasnella sp. 424]|nr:RNA-binding ATPase activator esf2 [Tulasnella sp. 424]KAG8981895.1 RNA-binding ATPase activator esf2 [Tulasnella sp. 425]